MTSPAAIPAYTALFPEAGEWTEADYLVLSDRGRLVELSDGNVEVLPMPNDFHQLIALRLSFGLHAFVSARKLGQVRFAPLPVRLWPGKIREPDLMFMSTEHASRIGTYWGVPDLAVEIVSEGGEQKDREVKRAEYAQAGVVEYWIIDPVAKSVELLRLNAGGVYDLTARFVVGEILESAMFPGFSMNLSDLFAE